MNRILYLCLLLLGSQAVHAQRVNDPQKISRYLIRLADKHDAARARGTQEQDASVCALMKLFRQKDVSKVASEYGCQILDSIGNIYFVQVPIGQLVSLSSDSCVRRIEAHEMPQAQMDEVPTQIGADKAWQSINLPQAFTGEGVVSGVVDFGYDFTHPMFHNQEGYTRISRFFDMTKPTEKDGEGFSYIGAEVDSLEHSSLAESQTHGTHVASIMAGSKVAGKKFSFSGIAPKSEIALAEIKMETIIDEHGYVISGDLKNGPDETTANCILAFKRIFDYADEQGKPCVINFSGGFHMPIDDPCILENEAIDALVGPGHILVSGSGNDGGLPTTMTKKDDDKQVTASFLDPSFLWVNTTQYQATAIDLYLVTKGSQNISFIIGSDDFGKIVNLETKYCIGDDTLNIAEEYCDKDTIFIKAYREQFPPSYINGELFHFVVTYGDNLYWRKFPYFGHVVRVMLWGDNPCEMYANPVYTPFVLAENPYTKETSECISYQHTVAWPAEAKNVIAVGALSKRMYESTKNNYLASFSSQGPSWENNIKPDVTALGVGVRGAYNKYSNTFENDKNSFYDVLVDKNGEECYFMAYQGTSTSSPIVAGTIALWLQAKPSLSPSDIKEVLAHSCKQIDDDRVDGYPNNMYGYGEIDAYAGLLYILGIDVKVPDISHNRPSSLRIRLDGRTLIVADATSGLPYAGEISLKVYSLEGKTVAQGSRSTINLTGLPQGIYALQIDSKNLATKGSTLIRL